MGSERQVGSFRDPAGFVYRKDGVLLRQINQSFSRSWDGFVTSGLHERLVQAGFLISDESMPLEFAADPSAHAVIRPELVPFISYPYEWSFSQLKDAAILTLGAMRTSMESGFWLRDGSAYNVQFLGGKPVIIDSLSFEPYQEGKPWPAYGQFCRHFLAPLALASKTNVALLGLSRLHIDGVPVELASTLLPKSTYLNLGILTHLHLHAAAGSAAASERPQKPTRPVSRAAIMGLIHSLESTINSLEPPGGKTTWGEYYGHTNYSTSAFVAKQSMVRDFLGSIEPNPTTIWDLGANAGVFSEVAAESTATVVAWDVDSTAVELAYVKWRKEKRTNLLPLLQDFTNPSPSLGWSQQERESLRDRGPADALLALALIHHLAIGNNVPLLEVARWLSTLGHWVVIEFVPKADSQVQRMLSTREDIFEQYHEHGFRTAISEFFDIVRTEPIPETERTLFLLRRRAAEG